VCAGPGIAAIYAYLKDCGAGDEPQWLATQLQEASDPTPVIVTAALQEPPPALCRLALEMFVSILGAEAGNLAMKVLATGGVYLGGGIARRILPLLAGAQFMPGVQRKGRLAPVRAWVSVPRQRTPDA